MVMLVSFGTLSPADWRKATRAVIVTFAIFFLELPPSALGSLTWRLRCYVGSRIMRGTVRLVASCKARVGIWQLSSSSDRARDADAGHPTADARKHASEFALDAWLSRRAR